MKRIGITPRQKRFVAEYLVDLNATRAAIRAGYSARNAGKIGPRLVGESRIAAAIQAGRARLAERTEITAARVLEELGHIAFSDIGDVLDFTGDRPRLRAAKDIPERARSAVSSVKVKGYAEGVDRAAQEVEVLEFKFWSKTDALEKLGRHLGLFDRNGAGAPLDYADTPLARYLAAHKKRNGTDADGDG